MNRFVRRTLCSLALAALLAVGGAGCTPTDETVNSLVDLTSTTAGGFVQIVVKAVIDGLLMLGGAQPDLTLPISGQST